MGWTANDMKRKGLVANAAGEFVHVSTLTDKAAKVKKLPLIEVDEKATVNYNKVSSGYITIGDRTLFVRSSWEANIAAYYEFQKVNSLILDWEYEPITFWFEAIKRGVRSYKPDFRLTQLDSSQTYTEVKGYMDSKSQTKLKRMKKYHPKIIVRLIEKEQYKEISQLKNLIPFWGQLDK